MTEVSMFTLPDAAAEEESEPSPAAAPEPSADASETGSVTSAELVPVIAVPPRERWPVLVLHALRDRAASYAESQKRHRTFWHQIWETLAVKQPESISANKAYIKSRAWLEPWMTGWVRGVFEWENVLYAFLIGRPVKRACRAAVFALLNIEKLADRQYRVAIAAGIFLVCLFIYLLNH